MSCINVMVGPSGSGKSWNAKNMLNSIGLDKAIIVSRDKIRELIFGYEPDTVFKYYEDLKNFDRNEKEVSKYLDKMVKSGLQHGKTVIVDNTHLKLKFCREYQKYGVLVNYIPTNTSLEECLKRNAARVRRVPDFIIQKQYREFGELKKKFDFGSYDPSKNWKRPPHDSNLPDCYIFDIDGTLAIKGDRSAYDWSKVSIDTPNSDIVNVQADLANIALENSDRLKIVICSGRDEICREDTEVWLSKTGIIYDELHMRPQGNTDKDYIIKERMWQDISQRYNIVAMFDDRDQVVDHARKLGFTVCQVNYGDF